MAAAATEMGLRPGTRSSSTAFRAMKVAAICTCLGSPRLEQKRDMKSPVVMRSTLVSSAFRISLKHLPISFLEIRETAQISGQERKFHFLSLSLSVCATLPSEFHPFFSPVCKEDLAFSNSRETGALLPLITRENVHTLG